MGNEDLTLTHETSGSAMARPISDDWNLRVYVAPVSSRRSAILPVSARVLRRSLWRDLALAIVIGLCAGFVIASLRMSNFNPIPPSVQTRSSGASSIHKPAPEPTSEEVARLKARNRRLEAFVAALKNRPPAKAPGR